MQKLLTLLFVIAFFTSCDTIKYLQIVDGSKANGTLTMMYQYGGFEKPIVQWDDAKARAKQRCIEWGYKNAEFFDAGISECIAYNQYGCTAYRITYKCQCTQ